MIMVTRRFEFDAAHRVLGHGGRCRHLHGHRYAAEVTVRAPELDALGMVVDFGVVKEKVGGWVDVYWDHNTLLNIYDPLLRLVTGSEGHGPVKELLGANDHVLVSLFGRVPYIMPLGNPTAENIARELFAVAKQLLPEFEVVHVRVYETPSCWADCTGLNKSLCKPRCEAR